MVAPNSLFHIAIKVPDVDRAVDFYRTHLGAELVDRGGDDEVRNAGLLVADKHVYLFDRAPYEAEGLVAELPYGVLHFGYVVDDVASAIRELDEAGVEILMEPTEFGDVEIAFFVGPGGTRIELFEYL
jgi:catechol 2,3-dioxygenase-like lactoylglutathione lyase family enzyme